MKRSRCGLAVPEILFVLSVLLLIVSIAAPAYLTSVRAAGQRQAYSQIRLLLSAALQYNREYRLWPSFRAPEEGDVLYGDKLPNAIVMNTLQAIDAEGNAGYWANKSKINFISMFAAETGARLRQNEGNEVLDPWGSPYLFVFDTNYDNVCNDPGVNHESVFGVGCIIWSCGPDRRSGTDDDILSWAR